MVKFTMNVIGAVLLLSMLILVISCTRTINETPTPAATSTETPTPTTTSPPSAPTLLSPENGTNLSSTSITYRWNASPGATNYWLVVSTKNSLDRADYSYFKTSRAVSGTTYTDTGYPTSGSTTYYWWVSAYDSAGWSDPSQVLANGFTFSYRPEGL